MNLQTKNGLETKHHAAALGCKQYFIRKEAISFSASYLALFG
jgi:hypothetical protein